MSGKDARRSKAFKVQHGNRWRIARAESRLYASMSDLLRKTFAPMNDLTRRIRFDCIKPWSGTRTVTFPVEITK